MNYTIVWQDEAQLSRAADQEVTKVLEAGVTSGGDEISDSRLVELVLSGEETAFEQLFDRYKRLVASIASRYFRRPEQIEEIIQISFTKVYFELGNFRGGQDFSFPAWAARITTNVCLDALRKQKRRPEDLECDLPEAKSEALFADVMAQNGNTEDCLAERDLAEKLLSHLEPEDRAVLQMLELEEMSVKEVAAVTGWSNSKIKIRAFRARRTLRKVLKKFL